ncbi:MAG: hypothetical protein HWE30_19135 [Methylocystaceae bacterium]|nr:hypothetical protein [Methylocystaceae bacterium]
MIDVLDRLEVRAQVSVPLSNIVLKGSALRRVVEADEFLQVSRLVLRAYCFEAVLRALLLANGQQRLTVDDFLRGGFKNGRLDLPQIERNQESLLKRYQVEQRERDLYEFTIGEHSATLQIVHHTSEYGSIFSNFSLRAFIPDSKSVSSSVLATLIAQALMAPVPDWPSRKIILRSSDGPHYVCTMNKDVSNTEEELAYGNLEDTISDAVGAMHSVAGEDIAISVWKSRQACLVAAGFDVGGIDGIYGPKTKSAERAYSYYHGGIEVDWSDRIFIRDLIWNAYKHNTTERVVVRPQPGGRRGDRR